MNFTHIKNKLLDFGMYFKRNTSIVFYIFIGVIIIAYASLYTYKTYFTTEASTITEEQKYKEVMIDNNIFQMVENEYNSETGFYVAKFIIKERNSNAPMIANDTLNISGVTRLDDNVLQELDIETKQITPTYFVVEIKELPKEHVELRLDFSLSSLSLEKERNEEVQSLYSYVESEEIDNQLSSVPNESYKEESYKFEIDNINEKIDTLKEQIEYYNNQITILEDQVEVNKSEMDLLTESEKTEMQSTQSGHLSEIESYKKEIEEIEEMINEREDKRSIIESNM